MPRNSSNAEVRLGPQGRLVVPAELRRTLGIDSGDVLTVRVEDGARLVLEKKEAAIARLQARFAGIPRQVRLSSELIAERRREARRERNR